MVSIPLSSANSVRRCFSHVIPQIREFRPTQVKIDANALYLIMIGLPTLLDISIVA